MAPKAMIVYAFWGIWDLLNTPVQFFFKSDAGKCIFQCVKVKPPYNSGYHR